MNDDQTMKEITNLLKRLSARQEIVLTMRWGLSWRCTDNKRMTLAEIGAHFGLSKERIRQIEARALWRLRYHVRKLRPSARELLQTMIDKPATPQNKTVVAAIEKLPPERHSVLSVRCPVCKAKRGRQCETRYQTDVGFVRWAHKERYARLFEGEAR